MMANLFLSLLMQIKMAQKREAILMQPHLGKSSMTSLSLWHWKHLRRAFAITLTNPLIPIPTSKPWVCYNAGVVRIK